MKSAILLLFLTTALLAQDLKVRIETHETNSALPHPSVSDETIYVHGTIERTEFLGYTDYVDGRPDQPPPHMAVISHCDTGVSYELDLDHHEYREVKLPKYMGVKEFNEQVELARRQAEGNIKSTTTDTGETRDFHGRNAKHLITKMTLKSDYAHGDETIDGWYLDLPQPGCSPEYLRWGKARPLRGRWMPGDGIGIGGSLAIVGPDIIDVVTTASAPKTPIKFIYSGFIPGGLAIRSKSVVHETLMIQGRKREDNSSIEKEVLEFSEGPLDPALFEIPAGFTKVDHLYKHMKVAIK